MILLWLLPLAAILHIIEEFVFPGGFAAWYRNYKASLAPSFTSRYLIIVNVVLVVMCTLPLLLNPLNGIALWLSMAAVVFFNSFFHIRSVIKTKKYSPGVATSVLMYVPLTSFGYWFFLTTGRTSIEQAVASFAIGIGYWIFASWNHRRRARISSTKRVSDAA
jgi:hypothetical protein